MQQIAIRFKKLCIFRFGKRVTGQEVMTHPRYASLAKTSRNVVFVYFFLPPAYKDRIATSLPLERVRPLERKLRSNFASVMRRGGGGGGPPFKQKGGECAPH